MTAVAAISGERTNPLVFFLPETDEQAAFVESLAGVRWSVRRGRYETRTVSATFQARIQSAGFRLGVERAFRERPEQALKPLGVLADNGREVIVHPRLAGYDRAIELAGWGATWDRELKAIRMPLSDAGRATIAYEPEVTDAFATLAGRDPRKSDFAALARRLAQAPSFEADDDALPRVSDAFQRDLFPYQGPGALAVALGHRLLADPAGVGKTSQALAAADIMRMQRMVVVCPPVLVTNWCREAQIAGVDAAPSAFRAGRKHPSELSRVTVVPDSLLTRADINARLRAWAPDLLVIDEAHRMKNSSSARSAAILDLAVASRNVVPMTATPVISGPHELVPMLEATGHMLPVFGGADAFLQRYCTRDRFGGFHPRARALDALHDQLTAHVMVRRRKEVVLPFLPKRFHTDALLEVKVADYRRALRDVVDEIVERIRLLMEDDHELEDAVEAVTADRARLIAPLRKAAAVLKVDRCVEMVQELLADGAGPVTVWVHHAEPAHALLEALRREGLAPRALLGDTSATQRQQAIDDFQAGTVDVLVASITAAGVGVTLTRGNRVLFLEADWSPALVSQALDRSHRIGQESPVVAQTLIALGTIDEHIQTVLRRKERTSTKVHGDRQDEVSLLEGELIAPKELTEELVELAVKALRR